MFSLPHNLGIRLAATYLAVALLLVLLLGTAILYLSHYYLYSRLAEDLDSQASYYAVFVGEIAPEEASYRSFAPSLAGRLDLPTGTVVRLFSTSGTLLGASRDIGLAPSTSAVAQVRSILFVPVPQDQPGRLYTAKPVVAGGRTVGIVEVSRDAQDVEAFLTTLRNVILLGGLGATAIAALVSTIMAAWISRPIRELEGMAKAIANHDFRRRIKWRRRDELGSLASGLNRMADQLALTIETLNSQQAHLRAVLDNLRDGVVALDADGQVALFNTAAQALDFSKLDLGDLAGRLADGRQVVEEEWIQEERTIGLTVAPILGKQGPRSGTLIVMRDVTRLHEIERMRQRFISNVSHELRTPLTSIKGFVSNMLDEGEAGQVRALTVIDEETDRLIRLVNELLELSRLQAGDLTMERRPIDLAALAEKAASLMQPRAQRLGILLQVRVASNLPRVLADPDRIEQVIVNLLDNALKFAPTGGEVTLEVSRAPDQPGAIGQMVPFESRDGLCVTVSDSGPGLTEDELTHAFDRLFQGKGSRAKSAGLGLTIAREIVQAHGGRIEITNRPAGGAAVAVFLPAIPST